MELCFKIFVGTLNKSYLISVFVVIASWTEGRKKNRSDAFEEKYANNDNYLDTDFNLILTLLYIKKKIQQ